MPRIGIFAVGYTRTDLQRLCRMMNRPQKYYQFERATRIPIIGNPDIMGYGYSNDLLSSLVDPHMAGYDIGVIVTSVPIQDNYFTRTIDSRLIISTSYQAEELMRDSDRSPEEYAALAICPELLSFEYQRISGEPKNALFHPDPRGCLFDFSRIKSQKLAKLISASICEACKGKLASRNLNENTIRAIESILARIRRPSLWKAIRATTTSSGLSFLYGGLVIGTFVNVLSSVMLSEGPLTPRQKQFMFFLAATIPLFPLLVYAGAWVRYIRSWRR